MCSARACAAAEAEIVVVAADAGDADTANANGDADVTGSVVCSISMISRQQRQSDRGLGSALIERE